MTLLPRVAIVPLKPFTMAKVRLAGALSKDMRQLLATRMAEHVITTLLEFVPTAVICRDDDVLDWAEALGALVVKEIAQPEHGWNTRAGSAVDTDNASLNAALAQATEWTTRQGARLMMIVAGDLPSLSAEDVPAMLRLPGRPGVVVAPDKWRTGTNALTVSPPKAASFRFGNNSLHLHRSGAYRAGLRVRTVVRPGLEHDVDTVQDLRRALTDPQAPTIDEQLVNP